MIISYRRQHRLLYAVGGVALIAVLSIVGYVWLSRSYVDVSRVSMTRPARTLARPTVAEASVLVASGTRSGSITNKGAATVPPLEACDRHRADATVKASETELNISLQAERKRLAAALDADQDLVAKAAGKYFSMRSQAYISYNDCEGSDCQAGEAERFALEKRETIGALANLAAIGQSPDVYFWALSACGADEIRSEAGHSCATLSRRKLVDLDSSNGWNWLSLAADANINGDSQGASDALYHAANSSNWSGPAANLTNILVDHIGANVDPLVLLNMLSNINSISTDMYLSGLNTMASMCPAGLDSNRSQVCQKLAGAVLASARNLLSLSIALKVGERVGLQGENIIQSREQLEKLQLVQPAKPLLSSKDGFSGCRNAIPMIAFLEGSLKNGELKALQANIGK